MDTVAKIKELRAGTAKEFWDLLSPEKSLFPQPCQLLYRGQANAGWALEPSLFRRGKNPAAVFGASLPVESDYQVFAEWMFLKQFIEHCDSIGLRIPNDSLEFRDTYFSQNLPAGPGRSLINTSLWPPEKLFEVMALAQHCGLPTRLLDWTRRSYVAAYFAASDVLAGKGDFKDSEEKRLAVWALDIERKGLFKELQIVAVPGGSSANLAAQRGLFTLVRQHGVRGEIFEGTALLDEYLSGQVMCPLVKVSLPAPEAPAVMDFCAKFGISGATLFPDYSGAARATMDDLHSWSQSNR
ncbi:MAG: FRG domain-containing protein [Candidatus Korobacteraceae bacterium]